MMRDMKVSPTTGAAAVPQSELDKYLDPSKGGSSGGAAGDEEEESEDDDAEVIDRSSRTDYYALPEKRRRGTGPGGAVEGPDGSLWPAP